MKSGTILFPSSLASIKDGIRAYSTTITYEIITSLEKAKLITLPGFFPLPNAYKLCDYLVCFKCVFLSLSNTNLLHPLPSHQNTVTGCGEEALRQSVMRSYKNVKTATYTTLTPGMLTTYRRQLCNYIMFC